VFFTIQVDIDDHKLGSLQLMEVTVIYILPYVQVYWMDVRLAPIPHALSHHLRGRVTKVWMLMTVLMTDRNTDRNTIGAWFN